MCAIWPGEVRACVLRHAKCARDQAPAFMATRQGGSDHPMGWHIQLLLPGLDNQPYRVQTNVSTGMSVVAAPSRFMVAVGPLEAR